VTPLRVTAHLAGPIAVPGAPIALDALLMAAVALREGWPPAQTPAELRPVPIPVACDPSGRFHLASHATGVVEAYALTHIHRRFPIEQAQAFGLRGGPRVLRINAGPAKSFRLPLELAYLREDRLDWWCVGEARAIRALVETMHYLGKKRASGKGRVAWWDVAPCDPWPGFPIAQAGRPLRALPAGWPDIDPTWPVTEAPLTPPYWMLTRSEPVVMPTVTGRPVPLE